MESEDECFQQPKQKIEQKPKNVSDHLWKKFKALEKRTNEITKYSTEKRIKHLQKTAVETVSRALSDEDRKLVQLPPAAEVGDDLQQGAVGTSSLGSCRKRPRCVDDNDRVSTHQQDQDKDSKEKEWLRVRGLMGITDHLSGVSHGSLGPKTLLELKMEAAISEGDFKMAEKLSDHMASREFGEKVAQAIDAKNFLEYKQKEEEELESKKKKKLHWGFEAKQRWETKSNM